MACTPSGVGLVQIRRSGFRAGRGTWVHKYMELGRLLSPEEAYKAVLAQGCDPDLAMQLKSLDVQATLRRLLGEPVGSEAELAMALDLSGDKPSARVLETQGRDYTDCTDTEAPLTLDLAWETENYIWVVDYKTSMMKSAAELIDDHAWQLNVCGLAYGAHVGWVKPIKIAIIHIDDSMQVRLASRNLDAMDRDDAFAALQSKAAELQGVPSDFVPGAHCKYCPRYDLCPATTGLIRQAMGGGDSLPVKWDEAYHAWRRLKQLADAYEERLKDHARHTPIDIGGGKVYGESTSTRSHIDPTSEDVRRILKEAGADSAIQYEMKVTSTGVLEALGGDRKTHKDVMGRIRDAGGMRVTQWKQLRESKAG